jgi:hypothetical protein
VGSRLRMQGHRAARPWAQIARHATLATLLTLAGQGCGGIGCCDGGEHCKIREAARRALTATALPLQILSSYDWLKPVAMMVTWISPAR